MNKETLYRSTDIELLMSRKVCHSCEGYFIMGDKQKRSSVDKITGSCSITDCQLTRVPINGVRLEATPLGQLPRGMAVWYLYSGLYKFLLFPDAFHPACRFYGEVDYRGNLQRLTQEEMSAKIEMTIGCQ